VPEGVAPTKGSPEHDLFSAVFLLVLGSDQRVSTEYLVDSPPAGEEGRGGLSCRDGNLGRKRVSMSYG
jgi:hypothetical protein